MAWNRPNTTPVPNEFFDERLSNLETASEIKVLLYIMRRIYGFECNRANCTDQISISQLCNGLRSKATGEVLDHGTGLCENSVRDALTKLENAGHITRSIGGGRGQASTFSLPLNPPKVWESNEEINPPKVWEPLDKETLPRFGRDNGHKPSQGLGGTKEREERKTLGKKANACARARDVNQEPLPERLVAVMDVFGISHELPPATRDLWVDLYRDYGTRSDLPVIARNCKTWHLDHHPTQKRRVWLSAFRNWLAREEKSTNGSTNGYSNGYGNGRTPEPGTLDAMTPEERMAEYKIAKAAIERNDEIWRRQQQEDREAWLADYTKRRLDAGLPPPETKGDAAMYNLAKIRMAEERRASYAS